MGERRGGEGYESEGDVYEWERIVTYYREPELLPLQIRLGAKSVQTTVQGQIMSRRRSGGGADDRKACARESGRE